MLPADEREALERELHAARLRYLGLVAHDPLVRAYARGRRAANGGFPVLGPFMLGREILGWAMALRLDLVLGREVDPLLAEDAYQGLLPEVSRRGWESGEEGLRRVAVEVDAAARNLVGAQVAATGVAA